MLKLIGQLVADQETQGYLVGGYVRDMLLRRPTKDIDLVVESDVFTIAQRLAVLLQGSYVALDQKNQVARVVLPQPSQLQIDISQMQGTDMQADLTRRDFTINALALPLTNLTQPLDLVGGRRDLANKTIRLVKPAAFSKDPGRILRAFRLAAELNFTIHPQTMAAIPPVLHKLPLVSGERIWAELAKLLACPTAGSYLVLAHQAVDLWPSIIPLVKVLQNTKQNYYHRVDVWQHSLETLLSLEKLLLAAPWPQGIAATLNKHLNSQLSGVGSRLVILKLACLMHDGGKAVTGATQPDGRITFYRHAQEGVEFAADLASRLRLSNEEKDTLLLLVAKHMQPLNLFNEPQATAAASYRFFKQVKDALFECLLLSLADVTATYQSTAQVGYQQHINHLLHLAINEGHIYRHPPRLVDGHLLMQHLQLKPSPTVGWLLQKIAEAQVEGKVTTPAQGLALAEGLLAHRFQSKKTTI